MGKEILKPERAFEHLTEEEIDEALKGSFPASDPPPWTLGVERPDAEPGEKEAAPPDRSS